MIEGKNPEGKWIVKEGRKVWVEAPWSLTAEFSKPAPSNGQGNAFDIGVIIGKAISQPKGESGIAYAAKHGHFPPGNPFPYKVPAKFPCEACGAGSGEEACSICLGRKRDTSKCPFRNWTIPSGWPVDGCGGCEAEDPEEAEAGKCPHPPTGWCALSNYNTSMRKGSQTKGNQ